ncbi:multidrug efflux pump [Paucidesulfovibrio gracilis DSM 16080]|uniref:Multidrug efflux pump n=1 Tax=Paucidesulfovibrio gracilis DSM 16080 TaxID=1121449 RepID=A0A1T4W479_9BACT|nr:efflux RND transporter permease subunit [Paucidesulfovibrio gracilis]SKA71858.1 multidrug efflux pump [Paucidesulfovibrio gracilis DSM 16080]
MFSRFFVNRPVFATVISLVICLAGAISLFNLPIAEFPEIVPPQVEVSANYPGASAEVIADTVAAPLEQQINGVDDMLYVNSASSDSGTLSITVTFAVGSDPDQNTINVNNRVQAALNSLPEEVRRLGVTVRKRSSSMLQVVNLMSEGGRYDTTYMSNYALVNIVDELKRLEGVGDATIFGSRDYSMRVWLQPDRLAQLGLTPADVAEAIKEQNAQFAAGSVGSRPTGQVELKYTVTTLGRLTDIDEFGDIILRANPDGTILRLRDVARIELGSKAYRVDSKITGDPSVAMGIYLAPGANALDTAERVHDKMEELSQNFPESIIYSLPYDTTTFVRISVEEVRQTLIEAFLLVSLIIFLFLQDWRATVIPVLAVPVSIIGAFAGMQALGFSINTLTMFGLVLAIGTVVDDAILVIENVERVMREHKLPPKQATIKAMDEVSGALVATVLVLCAVFVPVAFMGGLAGEMYKQFAVTIAVSVVISGVVALTLTPALCALLLREKHGSAIRPLQWFNKFFDRVTNGYTSGVRFMLKRGFLALLLFAALVACTWGLFNKVPGGLVPNEDKGYAMAVTMLPDGASMDRTEAAMDQLDQSLKAQPEVDSFISLTGLDILSGTRKSNSGTTFIKLKPWSERTGEGQDADSFVKRVFGLAYPITDAFVLCFGMPPIQGMSNTGGFEGYIQSRAGGSATELAAVTQKVIAAAGKRPELGRVSTTYSANWPQLRVNLDRERAMAMGVPVDRVFSTMQATFGSYYINDFNMLGRTFQVNMQSEAEYRDNPGDLSNVYVRSDDGDMIPLTALVNVEQTTGPVTVERFNVFPAAKLVGGPAPGYSSGQALQAMQEIADEVLGHEYALAWTGSAYQETTSGDSATFVFLLGLLMVFLILAAQYEQWTLPLAVIMVVPFALFGAIAATWLRGLSNDVYLQIALLTLIGLSAKNSILIVEFAVQLRRQGLSLLESAAQAAHLRFRPIIMTSMAFVLGVVPLAISSGAGAASRHAIGTGVIGGMLAATYIATFFIPTFYRMIMGATEWVRGKRGKEQQA